jgi:predicted HicB family RNase H-like nuclease
MSEHYTYRVAWSAEDQEFVGTCAEFPGLSHLAASREDALRGIEALVRDVAAEMRMAGEDVPEPIAERAYSGEFVTRIPPQLHMRLAIEAAEAGISLNRLVAYKLTLPVAVPRPPRRNRRGERRSA